MNTRKNQIKELMWREVASKSPSATMAFTFFALLFFFYHFGATPSVDLIRASCLIIVLANVIRFWISKKIESVEKSARIDRNILRLSIMLNAIGWSTIFTIGAIEKYQEPLHFGMMITVMSGFMTAAIITLAYDKSIFFPFQTILLVPVNITFIYQYVTGQNENGIYFFLFFAFYFFYQLTQYQTYRKLLIQRFNYQLDLELSFRELQKNQDVFKGQTAKMIHTAKIAALGDMAGGLAHEINNSLMVISGSTQQIERHLKKHDIDIPEIDTKFEQASRSILKIKSVIEGLKTFAQESETTPTESITLDEILQRTMIYCHELLKAHKVELQLGDVPNVQLNCRPMQIIQILLNLIKNADDAIIRSNAVERWIKFNYQIKAQKIFIRVSNSGPQIPPEYSNRLFQPFFTTKDVNQGTGLSLSISKGFATDHQGDLFYEASADHTTFTLTLPVQPNQFQS